jgi:FKBP-type peptidyl-prolyl cis-trans isomerase
MRRSAARRRGASRVLAAVVAGIAVLSLATACSTQKKAWNINLTPDVVVSEQGAAEPLVTFAPGGVPPKTLVVQDAVVGTGPAVKADSSVFINYMGVVTSSGQTIYSSWRVGHGVSIPLAKTPQAWQQALVGMKVGGIRVLMAPPSLLGAAPGSAQAKAGPVVYVIRLQSIS